MPTILNKALFESCINDFFHAKFDEEHQYQLELIEVKMGNKIESLNLEPFSLLFKADSKHPPIKQMMTTLTSDKTGEIQLFLIPRMPDKEGMYYEAIFS